MWVLLFSTVYCTILSLIWEKGLRERKPPLPKIVHPSFPCHAGKIAGVSPNRVQWRSLVLREPPSWSRQPWCDWNKEEQLLTLNICVTECQLRFLTLQTGREKCDVLLDAWDTLQLTVDIIYVPHDLRYLLYQIVVLCSDWLWFSCAHVAVAPFH